MTQFCDQFYSFRENNCFSKIFRTIVIFLLIFFLRFIGTLIYFYFQDFYIGFGYRIPYNYNTDFTRSILLYSSFIAII